MCTELREVVEEGMGRQLFIWDRDTVPGPDVVQNIVDGMVTCQTILILLSPGLFHSDSYSLEQTNADGNNATRMDEPGRMSKLFRRIQKMVETCCQRKRQEAELVGAIEMKGPYNEWIDFALLTALRLMKDKRMCVIKHGHVNPHAIAQKWRPLLFPNQHLSNIPIIKATSSRFAEKLQSFLLVNNF